MGDTPPQDLPVSEDLRLQMQGSYLEAHISGNYSLIRFKKQLAAIAEACRRRRVTRLLLNWTALKGGLRTADRYEIGSTGAEFLGGLRVASVIHVDHLDPKKFGAVVGQNRGLTVDTFTDRESALAWLMEAGKGS